MPGNEAGDRVHNFFERDLSQGQNHSQVVDGNWPVLSNNLWVGNQRQFGTPLNSSPKNFNVQQSDSERGHGSQHSRMQHGMHFTQSNLRPEFTKSQSQNQHQNLNGYMRGNQAFQTRHNEANFLGMDTESDRHNLTSRGFSIQEPHQANAPEHNSRSSSGLENTESPVNFNFLGGQQPMRQQSSFNEMQFMQQQAMLKQMQELQRQQQFQQLEPRQQHNDAPMHETSNYMWGPEVMTGNPNLQQRVAPQSLQGSSNGFMLSPEQGQAFRLMGVMPQQVDQSLYGVPVSNARATSSPYGNFQPDKPTMQQISAFPGNQYAVLPDQVTMRDGNVIPRDGSHGKNLFGHSVMENFQQMNTQQRNVPGQEFHGRRELAGSSETLQEQMVMRSAPSQTVATLDPTEEKILFGSDDSLWGGFGRSTIGAGLNVLEGPDVPSAMPSLQSGSWSALMQSAVAETSSADVAVPEEWSGLNFHTSELLPGNNPSSTFTQAIDNNLQSASALNARPFPLSDDTNLASNNRSSSLPAFQQPGLKFSNERSRSSRQTSEEGNKWLGHSSVHVDGSRNVSGLWANQQSTSSCDTGDQPCNKSNGRAVNEALSPRLDITMNIQENDNRLQHFQHNDSKRAMQGEMDRGGGGRWKVDSTRSIDGSEHVKSAAGSPHVNEEESFLNNINALPNKETSQQLPNVSPFSNWKNVDSAFKSKGNEGSNMQQHHMNRGPQVVESSMNRPDKVVVDSDKRENSNSAGSLRENVWLDASDSRALPGGKQKLPVQATRKPSGTRKFQYHPMGNLDVDVEPSYGAKHFTHSQATPQQVPRGLRSHEQGYMGQSKVGAGHFPKNSIEMEKGQMPSHQGKGVDETPSSGILSGFATNISSGIFAPNKSGQSSQNMLELLHKVDQSKEHITATHLSSSDCNPLSEKAEPETSDGSMGHLHQNQSSSASQGFGLQLAPPSQRLMPTPNRALPFQASQSVNSAGPSHVNPEIGEKGRSWLGPTPSHQSLPPRETSQEELRKNRSGSSGQMPASFSAAFTSGFPYSRNQLQNQHNTASSGEVASGKLPFDRTTSRFKDDSHDRAQTGESIPTSFPNAAGSVPPNKLSCTEPVTTSQSDVKLSAQSDVRLSAQPGSEAVPISQASVTSGMSQQCGPSGFPSMPQNVWTNVSAQQRLLGRKPPFGLFHSQLQPNKPEMTSSAEKLDVQDTNKGGNKGPSEVGEGQPAKESPPQQVSPENIDQAQKNSTPQEREPTPSNPSASQRDIEAFGRTLRPNNVLNQSYSLLHQMQAMKNTDNDPSNRGLKRFKGPGSGPDAQHTAAEPGPQLPPGFDTGVRDAFVQRTSGPPRDSKMLSFSSDPGACRDRSASSSVPSQDVLENNNTSVKEQAQIKPQMAPSWFNQYGTFKNGQMLASSDTWRPAVKTPDQQFRPAKPVDNFYAQKSVEQVDATAPDPSQVDNIHQNSTAVPVASENISSPQPLPPTIIEKSLVSSRPKKRKSAASELLPWHKEVTHCSQRLQNISTAELDWAHASNRLVEKVEDEAEIWDDALTILKPKRRLILTTQLMQQLLRPPPVSVLSADANLNYECVPYLAARLALGDTCSLLSSSGSDSLVSPDSEDLSVEKIKACERTNDHHLSKVMEDFIDKARKLENDMLRLDKRGSISDVRVECQDQEKFAVINRFARFHDRSNDRSQADVAEVSSASEATTNPHKVAPQKYVSAHPMPKNIPDAVQCLSL